MARCAVRAAFSGAVVHTSLRALVSSRSARYYASRDIAARCPCLNKSSPTVTMPRILIAECKQEVSTFNPVLSGYEDFMIRRGAEIIQYHRRVGSEVGGALSVFDATPGVELVPTYSAHFITSGGSGQDTNDGRT
jgi:hypothetical protein